MNPVLVALDVHTATEALRLAKVLAPHVGGFKVGLELLMGEGPMVVGQVGDLGLPVFVDAKLHDIPNTVAGAVRQLGSHGARWVTIHAAGGEEMLKAGVDALSEVSSGKAGVLAVTVLTSVDEVVLRDTGVSRSLQAQVAEMAALASRAGCEGVVCSAHEVAPVKEAASELIAVTPGIRPQGVGADDQRRVSTPEEAIAMGADFIVVGRAITAAPDLEEAARAIAGSVASIVK